jgi:hypothetical protein
VSKKEIFLYVVAVCACVYALLWSLNDELKKHHARTMESPSPVRISVVKK